MNLPLPRQLVRLASGLRDRIPYRVRELAWSAMGTPPGSTVVTLAGGSRRPESSEYQDLPVSIWSRWTVDMVQGAAQDHVLGTFAKPAMLCEAMQADDRVQSALNGRIKAVTKCDLNMIPSEMGGRKRQRVARELEQLWPEIVPVETIEQLQTWTILLGFALAELVWESRDGLWVPRIKVWHPLYIYYRVDARRYVAITMEGPVEIEPNDPKWFLYTPHGAYRGWLCGAVRSCAIPWMVRQYALRDWARYSEVHGLPQRKAKVPAAASAEDKARFFSRVKRLGAETSFLLPVPGDGQGWDVELLEARDRSWEAFQGLIAQCDKSITLAIRGTNLTSEVSGGSFAASKTHREEDSDYALSDAQKFSQAVRKQVLAPFCLYNYGDAHLAPNPLLEATPEEDKKAKAETIATVSMAVTELELNGWPVDRQKVSDEYGIPLIAKAPDGTPSDATPPDGAPTAPKADLPSADDESKLPGSEGESGANEPGGEQAARATSDAVALTRQHATAGQSYLDKLVHSAKGASVAAMRERIDEVKAAIANSKDPDDLRKTLRRMARDAKREKLAKVIGNAAMLSELAGRHAVQLEATKPAKK